jgi:hypothetical protein
VRGTSWIDRLPVTNLALTGVRRRHPGRVVRATAGDRYVNVMTALISITTPKISDTQRA